MSDRPRPERRRAARRATGTARTQARPHPPRRPGGKPSRPAIRTSGAGFLDYLIVALLVVLAVMIAVGLLILIRGGL